MDVRNTNLLTSNVKQYLYGEQHDRLVLSKYCQSNLCQINYGGPNKIENLTV
jgi:hypothetical protein